jgi:hypothetical protein
VPSTDSSHHTITKGELNVLIRDLELPKNKTQLLASRLQQWNLLHHSVKVTKFRTRKHEFEQFFKTVGYFTYCKHIDGLMDALHMRHGPEQWRLFIDASKTSLGVVSDEHWERFHQEISVIEHWYKGKWSAAVLGDYC